MIKKKPDPKPDPKACETCGSKYCPGPGFCCYPWFS